MKQRHRLRKIITENKGFTLLELLIVMVLGVILSVIAIPALKHFLNENQMAATVDRLVHAIRFARSVAITTHENVLFCGSRTGSTTGSDCDGDWSAGQLVKTSKGVLRVFSAIPKALRLVWQSSSGYNTTLVFAPDGFTKGQRGSFYLCPQQSPKSGRRIVVSNTGRLYVVQDVAMQKKVCL